MSTLINYEVLEQTLLNDLNKEMLKASEPFIQESLKKIEIEMRKDLAKNLIGLIKSDLVMNMQGTSLNITIKQQRDK